MRAWKTWFSTRPQAPCIDSVPGQRASIYRGSAAVSFFIPPKMATIRGESEPGVCGALAQGQKPGIEEQENE